MQIRALIAKKAFSLQTSNDSIVVCIVGYRDVFLAYKDQPFNAEIDKAGVVEVVVTVRCIFDRVSTCRLSFA
ncbi:hypothetical protein [Leptolyngbya sp. 7M]|uniref:hypothetical protein n=1 Tax=Leptolyngbya sp. 7M TaxID=2812896 RepID=UPI001B8AC0D1|nr:hypothetical protein [Leptolyngbya sp. 7M]QYO62701.1 hypothetical protein JVX88_22055 [Leptolyngbya sp. 7M]